MRPIKNPQILGGLFISFARIASRRPPYLKYPASSVKTFFEFLDFGFWTFETGEAAPFRVG